MTNLMHKFFFYSKFITFRYMFRVLLCSSSGGQNCITQYLVSSHLRWPSRAQVESRQSLNTHFLHIIFKIAQPSLSWLSNGYLSFCDILEHCLPSSFGIENCAETGTLSTCPNHRNLPFIVSEIIFVSVDRFSNSLLVRICQTPFCLFVSFFLSSFTLLLLHLALDSLVEVSLFQNCQKPGFHCRNHHFLVDLG